MRTKFRRIKYAGWGSLTLGEKIAKVILKVLRYALIVAVIAAIGVIVVSVGLGILVAFGFSSAVAGGFRNASRANTNRFYGHYDRW